MEVNYGFIHTYTHIIHNARSGQVWGHTPQQRVAASTLRRYDFGLRLATAQADAGPAMPISFIALRLAIAQADARPVMPISFR